MADTLDPKFVDKRISERLITGGQLDEKAYERYVKALPDVAEKATTVTTVMDADEYSAAEDEAALVAATEGSPQA